MPPYLTWRVSQHSALTVLKISPGWKRIEKQTATRVRYKPGVALTGRNRTGPPCSVGHPTAHAPGSWPPGHRQRYRRRQTTPTDDRHQRAKQYWPIRRASNETVIVDKILVQMVPSLWFTDENNNHSSHTEWPNSTVLQQREKQVVTKQRILRKSRHA